jgi:hypothetical protein
MNSAILINKAVLVAVCVTVAFVAAVFWNLHRRAPNTEWLIREQWRSMGGVPDADQRDEVSWKKTPEYVSVRAKMISIGDAVFGRRSLTTPDEVEVAISWMDSPHYQLRRAGTELAAFARSEPARSVLLPHVEGLLSDRTSVVRLFAADCLGKMGDKSAIPSLRPLLKDPIPLVAKAAEDAISKLQSLKDTVPEK